MTDVIAGVHETCLVRNRYVKAIVCNDDEVLVKHGARSQFSEVIVDEGRTRLLGPLLQAFSEPTTLEALLRSEVISPHRAQAAAELTSYLRDRRVLVDPSEDPVRVHLATFLAGTADGTLLPETNVAVVGAGPIGVQIADQLSAFKLGSVHLADAREETMPSSSPRQASRFAMEPGDPSLTAILEDCGLAIVAWEWFSPTLFHAVNETAVATCTPWMLTYIDGSELLVGPIFVPRDTPCYLEFESQFEAGLTLKDEYLLYKEHIRRTDGPDGLGFPPLPSFCSVLVGLTVTSALRFLAVGHSPTVGRALRVDLERFAIDTVDVLAVPRCPACSPQRPAYRHLYL